MKNESKLPHFNECISSERWLNVNDRIRLKVFEFQPVVSKAEIPVIIVTGLATMINSFTVIIKGLSKTHPVYYFETREKTSSIIKGKADFGIETMSRDLALLTRELDFKNEGYAMIGYSFGAAIVADSFRFLNAKPKCLIFMEPTTEFNYPMWSLLLIRWFGFPLYKVLKPLAKWYLLKFHINKEEDNVMKAISFQSLDNADPAKIRKSILAIAGYKIWTRISDITCPSLVVGTSRDGLHPDKEVKHMLDLLLDGSFIDLETNERTHNEEMVEVSMKYFNECTQKL